MAEAPKATRRSSSSVRSSTHGRGGAGNIGYTATEVDPTDLQTPTLKGEVYTTGRGGTGNMAKNTDAEEARRAQDVVAPPHHEPTASTHIGRGGAANVFKPNPEEVDKAKKDNAKVDAALHLPEEEKHEKGLLEKGKEWFHKIGK